MPTEQTLSRRDRILAAAEAEFAAHGFPGARVERIAAAAAVNKQLLFHYFDSKAGLYKAVANAVASRSAVASPSGTTPAERLRKLIDQLVGAAWTHGGLLSDEWRSSAASTAIRIVEDGQRSGHFRDDVEPRSIADIVVAASFGSSANAVNAKRAEADQASFASSLFKMVIDHCNWR